MPISTTPSGAPPRHATFAYAPGVAVTATPSSSAQFQGVVKKCPCSSPGYTVGGGC